VKGFNFVQSCTPLQPLVSRAVDCNASSVNKPLDTPSSGDVLRLSCSLGQARMPVESAVDLGGAAQVFDYIAFEYIRGYPFMTSTRKFDFSPCPHEINPPLGHPHVVDMKYTSLLETASTFWA